MSGSLVAVAEVTKAFGIKGEIVVRPFSEVARFAKLGTVHFGVKEGQTVIHQVEHVAPGRRGVRVSLADVSTREEAEQLVGSLMFVGDSDARELPPGEFFIHQLIGLRVVEESGKEVGTLRDVLKMPAQDIYLVEDDGREIMIPAVREFVREIRPAEGIIVVRLIEGLGQE